MRFRLHANRGFILTSLPQHLKAMDKKTGIQQTRLQSAKLAAKWTSEEI